MAYWKPFDFTSRLMPVRAKRESTEYKEEKLISLVKGKAKLKVWKKREIAFENEEGCMRKVIKPVLSTASFLNNAQKQYIHLKTAQA